MKAKPRLSTDAKHAHLGVPKPLEPLRDGYARCGGCGRTAAINANGLLHGHLTPEGHTCPYRVGVIDVHLDELPDVNIRHPRTSDEPSRLDSGSACEDCGKWLPGERRLCGQCCIKRGNV